MKARNVGGAYFEVWLLCVTLCSLGPPSGSTYNISFNSKFFFTHPPTPYDNKVCFGPIIVVYLLNLPLVLRIQSVPPLGSDLLWLVASIFLKDMQLWFCWNTMTLPRQTIRRTRHHPSQSDGPRHHTFTFGQWRSILIFNLRKVTWRQDSGLNHISFLCLYPWRRFTLKTQLDCVFDTFKDEQWRVLQNILSSKCPGQLVCCCRRARQHPHEFEVINTDRTDFLPIWVDNQWKWLSEYCTGSERCARTAEAESPWQYGYWWGCASVYKE